MNRPLEPEPTLNTTLQDQPPFREPEPEPEREPEEGPDEELIRSPEEEESVESPVNYDDDGVAEVELEGTIYRFDSGKQGTALCLSRRVEGTWRWEFLGEMRWDGRDLRSKQLGRPLLSELSVQLRRLMSEDS